MAVRLRPPSRRKGSATALPSAPGSLRNLRYPVRTSHKVRTGADPPTVCAVTWDARPLGAAATSISAPTRRASSTSQRISDGERVHLRSDGPGLNVAGALVNGEDHAFLGHQTVRHLEGRRHSALAEEAFA